MGDICLPIVAQASAMTRILTCYYRPKPGGFCTRLFRALDALLAAGHEVHYLAVQPFPVHHAKCHFHRFPWPERYTNNLAFWLSLHILSPLLLVYLTFRYRISHLFAFGTNYGYLLQLSRLAKRIPLTLFLRSDVLETHRLNSRPRWLILMDYLIEGAAIAGVRLFAVSQHLLETTVARHRIAKPSVAGVLPNNLPQDNMTANTSAIIAGKPLRMACVGILEPLKNHALVIDAMAPIEAAAAHLYLYGEGPLRLALETRCAKLRIQDRTYFRGWTSASDNLWDNIDLLLFPSLLEGSPNAVLEAVSRGIPVLASDIPAHREILPHSALLDARDPSHWTRMIQTIVKAPALQLDQLRTNQDRTTAHLRFDWDARITTLITDSP